MSTTILQKKWNWNRMVWFSFLTHYIAYQKVVTIGEEHLKNTLKMIWAWNHVYQIRQCFQKVWRKASWSMCNICWWHPTCWELECCEISNPTEQKLKWKPREWKKYNLLACKSKKPYLDSKCLKKYIWKLKEISNTSSYLDYRSLRTELSWSSNSRLDISCAVAELAQLSEEPFVSTRGTLIKEIHKIVQHLKRHQDFTLTFTNLDNHSLRLQTYSGASFA